MNTFPYKQSQENLLRQDGNLRPNFSLLLGIHPQPSHVTQPWQNCRMTRPYYQRLANSSTTLRSSLELKKNLQQQQQRGQLLLLQIAVCKFAIDMPPDQGAGTMMMGFVELWEKTWSGGGALWYQDLEWNSSTGRLVFVTIKYK